MAGDGFEPSVPLGTEGIHSSPGLATHTSSEFPPGAIVEKPGFPAGVRGGAGSAVRKVIREFICQIRESPRCWGTLDRLDPATGAPQRNYEIAPGTEGIAFGSAGQLWAVSEAGSRHTYDHPFLGLFEPFFPLVFALDLSRLE